MAQVIAYMLANADLALGRDAEARATAQNLSVAALESVEPDNDWPARLALLQAELGWAGERGEARRQQLAAALAVIAASHDDDREYLYTQGNALLTPAGSAAGAVARRR
jgi:hypothetical protein